MKMKVKFLVILNSLLVVCFLFFQNFTDRELDSVWTGKGLDNQYLNPNNWHKRIAPNETSRIYISNSSESRMLVITNNDKIKSGKIIGPGYIEDTKSKTIINGGSILNHSYWKIGNSKGSLGAVYLNEGLVSTRDLFLGANGGVGKIYMNGGKLEIKGHTAGLQIPGNKNGVGIIHLHGGEIALNRMQLANGGRIYIGLQGVLKIPIDQKVILEKYLKEKLITPSESSFEIIVNYDQSKNQIVLRAQRRSDLIFEEGNAMVQYDEISSKNPSPAFYGWPANGGIWSWNNGKEILVHYYKSVYKERENLNDGHFFDPNFSPKTVQSRSIDGGKTWESEEFISKLQQTYCKENLLTTEQCDDLSIKFDSKDFAFKVTKSGLYYYSYDKGRTWYQGKNILPKPPEMNTYYKARTDYVIEGPKSMMFCLSYNPRGNEQVSDGNSICMRTDDGAKKFQLLSNMLPKKKNDYTIMPSTIMHENILTHEKMYISVVRHERSLSILKSSDGGNNWEIISQIGTKKEETVWNPGQIIKLQDGRILITYGFRRLDSKRKMISGIATRTSDDIGITWSDEKILRNDGNRFLDVGYPRLVQNHDGAVVIVYYYNTATDYVTHIERTIYYP